MIKFVEKKWGSEEWLINREYCAKYLNLNKGWKCSLHCHHLKDETFVIMAGKVFMEVGNTTLIMVPGDTIIIEPYQKHRFTGIEDSKILEISTHHEDSDSYRDEESGPVMSMPEFYPSSLTTPDGNVVVEVVPLPPNPIV